MSLNLLQKTPITLVWHILKDHTLHIINDHQKKHTHSHGVSVLSLPLMERDYIDCIKKLNNFAKHPAELPNCTIFIHINICM